MRKMALSSMCRAPSSRSRFSASRCSHRVIGGWPNRSVVHIVVSPVGCQQIDAAQVSRIVTNDHPLLLADPGSQYIRPVLNRMERDSLSSNQAPLERQKIDEKPARIGNRSRFAASGRGRHCPTMPRSQAAIGGISSARCLSRWYTPVIAWASHRSNSSSVIAAYFSGSRSPLACTLENVVPGRR